MSSFPSARLPSSCAACRQPGALQVGQTISQGRLTWFERFACACGHGFEADGVGLPTPAARAALLAQSGTAELWLDAEAGRPVLVKLLTLLAGLVEAEASGRLVTLPALAWSGTHAEVAFLQAALEQNGVAARVVHRVAIAETPG
ncbi:MAG: hypothetical protein IT380_03450 [Myxococcales bacterium]|nr:hypothetical protein [Myxococcales bacterium]